MSVDYAVADLRDSIRLSSSRDKVAIVDLVDGSKILLEFEDSDCKTLEVYGKLSKSVERRFSEYTKKYSNCFGAIPVGDIASLLSDIKSYRVTVL